MPGPPAATGPRTEEKLLGLESNLSRKGTAERKERGSHMKWTRDTLPANLRNHTAVFFNITRKHQKRELWEVREPI